MSWPIPYAARTIHLIGDTHFGGGISEFNPERQAIVTKDVVSSISVPQVTHRIQLGDATNVATSTEDAQAAAWLATLGGTMWRVIGNHDIWNVRDKAACAAAWGLASADYTADLGYAKLIVVAPDSIEAGLVGLTYNTTTLNYLDAQLTSATKPVIIGIHPPLRNTVGVGGTGQYISDNDFFAANPNTGIRAVLAAHPSVPIAWTSGHTHSPINAPFLVKAETVGSRVVAAINASALAYCGTTREWTDQLCTLFLTVTDDAFVTRFRNHGAQQWVGGGPDGIRAWSVPF